MMVDLKGLPIRFIHILVLFVLCNLVSNSSAQVRGLPGQLSTPTPDEALSSDQRARLARRGLRLLRKR